MSRMHVEVPTSRRPRLHEPGVAPREAGGQRAMDSGTNGRDNAEHLDRDLSLQEATRLYDVSLRTLRHRVRCGEIPAYKTRGPWGQEWRVNGRTLEAAEFPRRPVVLGTDDDDPRVAALEQELATLRRVVVAERQRADRADSELG